MLAHRIVMTEPGPPQVLHYETHELAAPGPGEVLLRQTAIGLNYIDIQHRTGRYKLPQYPSPIGLEGAGVVEAIGRDVNHSVFFNLLKPQDLAGLEHLRAAELADRDCPHPCPPRPAVRPGLGSPHYDGRFPPAGRVARWASPVTPDRFS